MTNLTKKPRPDKQQYWETPKENPLVENGDYSKDDHQQCEEEV